MASLIYYIGPGFASWVASWSAYFFDLIVRLALDSGMYALTFLTQGWSLVLSLANMFFIFILIYAAFTIMLQAETTRTMQTLAWVIAIALMVNFSFFFTRVVIDAGNILGVQFYNAVAYPPQGALPTLPTDASGATQTPDITAPFMKAIGADQLLGTQSFNIVTQSLGGGALDGWKTLLVYTVVFLFAAVIFWIIAVALLMVGLKFMLRIIGLWLVLIASPLAFVAQTLSNTRSLFSQWLRSLIGLSLYPAVFLFMFWILNQFAVNLGSGLQLLGLNSSAQIAGAAQIQPATLVSLIANVSIRMMFIVTLIYLMLRVSDWIIEQAGGMATTLVSRGAAIVAGGGFRSAAWAGALAGRNTAGRAAFNAAQSGRLKDWAATSKIGSTLLRGSSALSRGTFDLRNAPGAGIAGSRTARTLTGTRDVNAGRASQRSFAQSVDDKSKRLQAQADQLRATPTEAWNAQRKIEQEYDAKNGAGAYAKRVSDLQKSYDDSTAAAQKKRREASAIVASNPAAAKILQQEADAMEKGAKDSKRTLDDLQMAGTRQAQTSEKGRLAALANRLDRDNRNKVASGTPAAQPVSHGAISAASTLRNANVLTEKKKKAESAAAEAAPATAEATHTAAAPAYRSGLPVAAGHGTVTTTDTPPEHPTPPAAPALGHMEAPANDNGALIAEMHKLRTAMEKVAESNADSMLQLSNSVQTAAQAAGSAAAKQAGDAAAKATTSNVADFSAAARRAAADSIRDYKKNDFERFGLQPGASAEEIRSARNKLAKMFHPDTAKEAADPEVMRAINEISARLERFMKGQDTNSQRPQGDDFKKAA